MKWLVTLLVALSCQTRTDITRALHQSEVNFTLADHNETILVGSSESTPQLALVRLRGARAAQVVVVSFRNHTTLHTVELSTGRVTRQTPVGGDDCTP